MIIRRGHTYVAAAMVPSWVPLSVVRNRLIAVGFVNVSVRNADGPNYNAIGQGTWTGPDQDVEFPSGVVSVRDITPAEEAVPVSPGSPAPAPVGPAPAPVPGDPSPAPAPARRRRRAAPAAPDPSVQVVAVIVSGIGALVLWKLKKGGFWDRRGWR